MIDRSDWLADNATEISEDPVEPSQFDVQPIDHEPGGGSGGFCGGASFSSCPKPPLNNDRNFFEDLWDDTVEGTGRSIDVAGDVGAWLWKYRGPILSGVGAISGIICLFPGPHSLACGIAGAAFALSSVDGFIGCMFGGTVDACFMLAVSVVFFGSGKVLSQLGSNLFSLARTFPWGTRWLPRAGGLMTRVAEGSLGLADLTLNLGMAAIEADTIKSWDSSNRNRVQFPQMCAGKTC
ncbi:hypothetical protein E1292_46040 [Nonomuraea deserti]|uniref:Uncharacterized protein n=1 Tax=Nonomuraea deserti TaxID=1848322 RepID=A0A4R4U9S0_9ACTN|nr:hypothetical protein E1292_46040 [Nonomuraea deserti]